MNINLHTVYNILLISLEIYGIIYTQQRRKPKIKETKNEEINHLARRTSRYHDFQQL